MVSALYRRVKRGADIALSAAGLLATAPLLSAVVVAVRLDSPGPVLFKQERVGQHGRPFKIWKFRTMVQDAEKLGAQLTAGGDQRITRVGRLLRATKIDELPQLVNVLLGQMSLVGPRPEVAKYVTLFRDDYDTILTVAPGITDEASIRYRHEEQILAQADDPEAMYVEQVLPQKIALYQKYVNDLSWRTDLSILWRTIAVVLFS